MSDSRIIAALRVIRAHSGSLTRQQVQTLRGQALSVDVDGAIKGLTSLLKRKE